MARLPEKKSKRFYRNEQLRPLMKKG